jgi:hypothetical protein
MHPLTGEQIPVPQKVLITGTPRSGTQWIRQILQEAFDLEIHHEPLPWKGQRDLDRLDRYFRNDVLKNLEPYVEVNCYANQSVAYWHLLGARVFHIVRDPHDTAASIVRVGLNIVGVRFDENAPTYAEDHPMGHMSYRTALDHWAETHTRLKQTPCSGPYRIEDMWDDDLCMREFLLDVSRGLGVPLNYPDHMGLVDNLSDWEYHDVPPREEMPEYIKALARDFGYEYD